MKYSASSNLLFVVFRKLGYDIIKLYYIPGYWLCNLTYVAIIFYYWGILWNCLFYSPIGNCIKFKSGGFNVLLKLFMPCLNSSIACYEASIWLMSTPVWRLYKILFICSSSSLASITFADYWFWAAWRAYSSSNWSTFSSPFSSVLLVVLPILCTILWCWLRFPFYRNDSTQSPMPHLKGFSRVWTKSCSSRYYFRANFFSQLLHSQAFLTLCIYMCLFRLYLVLKILSHFMISHLNNFYEAGIK